MSKIILTFIQKISMSFLNAEWRKLAMVNYIIEPSILAKFVPFGTELDLWEGNCYVSVVGFMFVNTKLLGIPIPFHTNFEEVNLRFYVKRLEYGIYKRGVVFIKEIVPKAALTFVANTIYKEHYETLPMRHEWVETQDTRVVKYEWKKNNHWQSIQLVTVLQTTIIEENSETEFITEHYWGYAKVNDTTTNEYEVTHPKWQQYKVESFDVNIDFAANYGADFAILDDKEPSSVMLAEGSGITVENKRKLKLL